MKRIAVATIWSVLFLTPGSAALTEAAFLLVEDFEGCTLDGVDGQDGWIAAADSSVVSLDPSNPNNQVLSVSADSTFLYKALNIGEGETRTLFLRFRFAGQVSCSFGMSDLASPDQFGDFEVELSMTNEQNDLRINDDGHYAWLATLSPDTWYNVWIVVDNANDTSSVYLSHASFTGATEDNLLSWNGETVFGFRSGTLRDLVTFFIKTGGGSSGNSGPLYIDDIYVEDSSICNLTNPTVLPPDFNGDGDVDLDDLFVFTDCLGGPGESPPTSCSAAAFERADLDHDADVDLHDFAGFAEMFTSG